MRSLILVACLATVAVVLQGCGGGGGGSPSTKCMHDKIDMVSQTATGTLTGTVAISQAKPMPIDDGTIVEKVDFEKFNMRSDVSMTISVPPVGVAMLAQVRTIFNAEKKEGVVWQKVSMKGVTMKTNCTKYDLTGKMPSNLTNIWKTLVLPTVQNLASCGGSDGKLDTWNLHIDQTLPPSMMSAAVNMDDTMKMDSNYLMTSNKVKGSMTMKVGTTTVSEGVDLDMEVASTAGGPKAEDLDYSDETVWGVCHEGKLPTPPGQMTKLFHPVDSSEASLIVDKVINAGLFPQMVLSAIQAHQESQHKEVVV